ncbi:hypothetical protein [Nonomuraea sp. NPDC005650]|uniref:hypothetical protein n=1 Tax=Nonomuraea sp. NPDC005650 TaxID=3157045 RepID=UPI0033BE2D07
MIERLLVAAIMATSVLVGPVALSIPSSAPSTAVAQAPAAIPPAPVPPDDDEG